MAVNCSCVAGVNDLSESYTASRAIDFSSEELISTIMFVYFRSGSGIMSEYQIIDFV